MLDMALTTRGETSLDSIGCPSKAESQNSAMTTNRRIWSGLHRQLKRIHTRYCADDKGERLAWTLQAVQARQICVEHSVDDKQRTRLGRYDFPLAV